MREALVPLERLPLALSDATLASTEAVRRFRFGQALEPGDDVAPPLPETTDPEGYVAVRGPWGDLLGVATLDEARLQPRVVVSAE